MPAFQSNYHIASNLGQLYLSTGEGKFGIQIATNSIDTYPHNFLCVIKVWDYTNHKAVWRRGKGKFIGNFSPIWFSWKGKRWQVDEFLREIESETA